MQQHVLLVEDDQHIAELLELHLQDQNFKVTVANNGFQGNDLALQSNVDMVVLDINLPGINGLEICRNIRRHRRNYIPVLLLTAKNEENDIVLGLEVGADDYISKPFSVWELVARIKAILRRTEVYKEELQKEGKMLQFADMVIDIDNRIVTLSENRIELTPKEFDLLYTLAKKPGRSFSRQQLLDTVWGYQFEGLEHTVNSHINRLRMKIEQDIQQPRFILTTWGVGYRFNDEW